MRKIDVELAEDPIEVAGLTGEPKVASWRFRAEARLVSLLGLKNNVRQRSTPAAILPRFGQR